MQRYCNPDVTASRYSTAMDEDETVKPKPPAKKKAAPVEAAVEAAPLADEIVTVKAEAPAKKAEAAVQPAQPWSPPVNPRLPGGRVPRAAKR